MSDDRPTLKVEISFTEAPTYPDVWTDVTNYALGESIRIDQGGTDEFEAIQAGTASLMLYNDDRRFDPDYTGSPYYPNVRPLKRIRITATWNGVDYPQFTGYILDWSPRRRLNMALVEITCVDGLGTALAQNAIPASLTMCSATIPGASSYYSLFTGALQDTTNFFPMTRLTVAVDEFHSITGGTFRIQYNGNWTSALNVSDTPATWIAAIEALPGMSPKTVFVYDNTNLIGAARAKTFLFGGDFIGTDISASLAADTTSITKTAGGVITTTIAASTTPFQPGFFSKAGSRSVRATISPASAGGSIVNVYGVQRGTYLLSNTYSSFSGGGTTLTLPTTFDQIFNVAVSLVAGDVGKTITAELLSASVAAATSGTMIFDLSTYGGWKQEEVDADAGQSTLQAYDPIGDTPVAALQLVAKSEDGIVFVGRNGNLVFRDRGSTNGATPLAVFGHDTGELAYEDAFPVSGERYIRNDVRVTRTGGTEQRVVDTASINRYYARSLVDDNLLLATDAEALTRAQFNLGRYTEPHTRVQRIVLRGELDPDNLWPVLLGAELGNPYTVNYPVIPGATPTAYPVVLRRSTTRITTTGWVIEWSLSPRIGGFTLDESDLDGDDLLFY